MWEWVSLKWELTFNLFFPPAIGNDHQPREKVSEGDAFLGATYGQVDSLQRGREWGRKEGREGGRDRRGRETVEVTWGPINVACMLQISCCKACCKRKSLLARYTQLCCKWMQNCLNAPTLHNVQACMLHHNIYTWYTMLHVIAKLSKINVDTTQCPSMLAQFYHTHESKGACITIKRHCTLIETHRLCRTILCFQARRLSADNRSVTTPSIHFYSVYAVQLNSLEVCRCLESEMAEKLHNL